MKTEICYKPAFATIFLTLNPGETITAEGERMTSMDLQLSMRVEFSGGLIQDSSKSFLVASLCL